MIRTFILALTSVALTASANADALLPCDPDTSWKTVDLYQRETGATALLAGVASYQNMAYAAGEAQNHWIIRRSTNSGETWSTINDLSQAQGRGIAVDHRNGHIYSIGFRMDPEKPSRWVVRKSMNQGVNWSIVDVLGDGHIVNRISVDSQGHVIVIGSRESATSNPIPIMRRSVNGGSSWTNVNYASLPFQGFALATGPAGQVLVAGYDIAERPDIHGPVWKVRYSPNGKAGWREVDSFRLSTDLSGSTVPLSGSIASDGRIVVVGSGSEDSSDTRHWITRMSLLSRLKTWRTVDNYRPLDFSLGFGEAVAQNATFGRLGRVFVNGRDKSPASDFWGSSVREGRPPLTLFTISDRVADPSIQTGEDEFVYSGGMSTLSNGHVLSGSNLQLRESKAWLIRKMNCAF